MVGDDRDLVAGSFCVDSPCFEAFDYCEEFLVVDFVVELCGRELPGVISHGVEAFVFGVLL